MEDPKLLVSYGMSKKYLSHWGTKDAIREILQNFLDYGDYKIRKEDGEVYISNNYELDESIFLIGESQKKGDSNIGGYGEGLKMAGLIFAREDAEMTIIHNQDIYRFTFSEGVSLCLEKTSGVFLDSKGFTICYADPDNLTDKLLLNEEEIIFSRKGVFGQGSLLSCKELYSGGLHVCSLGDKFEFGYDIPPRHLNLDRDRKRPSNFDLGYHSSLIKAAYYRSKSTPLDIMTNLRDNEYIREVNKATIDSLTFERVKDTVVITQGEKKCFLADLLPAVRKEKNVQKKITDLLYESLSKDTSVYDFVEEYVNSLTQDSSGEELENSIRFLRQLKELLE